jgi:hypothetical protein
VAKQVNGISIPFAASGRIYAPTSFNVRDRAQLGHTSRTQSPFPALRPSPEATSLYDQGAHRVALSFRSVVRRQSLRSSGPNLGSLPHRELGHILQAVGFQVEETRGISYLREQFTRLLPSWLWMPRERSLGRLNIAPQYAVNQLLIARRSGGVDHLGSVTRSAAR